MLQGFPKVRFESLVKVRFESLVNRLLMFLKVRFTKKKLFTNMWTLDVRMH